MTGVQPTRWSRLACGTLALWAVAALCSSRGPVAQSTPAPSNPLHRPSDVLLGFVDVPGASLTMGRDLAVDPEAFDNERWSPAEAVGVATVEPFAISRFEVTVAEFRAFTEATGFKGDARALSAPANHPVTFVSWTDALAYCRWVEQTLKAWPGTPQRLAALLREGARVTLPSETEWELAARSTDRRVFPWGGGRRTDRANFETSHTSPVGQFVCPECPFGLSDMSGNVWEWTRSAYRPHLHIPGGNHATLDADALWAIRGGHFGDPARLVRAAARGAAEPAARRAFIGFRVAIAKL